MYKPYKQLKIFWGVKSIQFLKNLKYYSISNTTSYIRVFLSSFGRKTITTAILIILLSRTIGISTWVVKSSPDKSYSSCLSSYSVCNFFFKVNRTTIYCAAKNLALRFIPRGMKIFAGLRISGLIDNFFKFVARPQV